MGSSPYRLVSCICKKGVCCDTLQPAESQIKVRAAVWYIRVRESDFVCVSVFGYTCV